MTKRIFQRFLMGIDLVAARAHGRLQRELPGDLTARGAIKIGLGTCELRYSTTSDASSSAPVTIARHCSCASNINAFLAAISVERIRPAAAVAREAA